MEILVIWLGAALLLGGCYSLWKAGYHSGRSAVYEALVEAFQSVEDTWSDEDLRVAERLHYQIRLADKMRNG